MSDRDADNFSYELVYGKAETTGITPQFGILLIGGSEADREGDKQATQWFLKRARGGNYLVLRCGKIGDQAAWISDHYPDLINSAAELSINSRAAANNPEVIDYIQQADLLFIAGGDQNKYEDFWEGTEVEKTLNYLINKRKVPISGSSAGMAILADYYYAPAHDGVLSSEILDNPFHHNTKDFYRSDFIKIPLLKDVVADTHLDRVDKDNPEPRYGRSFGFLARNYHHVNYQRNVYVIALEEGAFVAIDEQGIAHAFGNGKKTGQDSYFLQTIGLIPEQMQEDLPLIWDQKGRAVKVYIIHGTPEGSGSFDLHDWTTAKGGKWEYWSTRGGMKGFKRRRI
jgi:cyanophycinase-like exopeptidase